MRKQGLAENVWFAIFSGLAVTLISLAVHLLLSPKDLSLLPNAAIGDFVGGLVAVVLVLIVQLRHEEVCYQRGVERAAIVSELNHVVRNAVFPLCLAVQKTGSAEAIRTADEAVHDVNDALTQATIGAVSNWNGHVRQALTGPAH